MNKVIFKLPVLLAALLGITFSCDVVVAKDSSGSFPLYSYTLSKCATAEAYDEAMVVACLQGIINRKAPTVYIPSATNSTPSYWLKLFTSKGKWLNGHEIKPLPDLDALFTLADEKVKGAVIWDPAVPASMNVATTIAGIEDWIVLNSKLERELVHF
ncbi:MAG: GxGYxYP domain-containing protein [Prolixibacteraceae bacterium]